MESDSGAQLWRLWQLLSLVPLALIFTGFIIWPRFFAGIVRPFSPRNLEVDTRSMGILGIASLIFFAGIIIYHALNPAAFPTS
jgi:hypothetical protein